MSAKLQWQFGCRNGLFIASLPAMGWTGQTFTNYRCWYIAVFPSALLIIVSIMSLMTIITVCVLYFLILHRAVTTANEIRAFQETNHKIAYVNRAYDDDEKRFDEVSETTVTITVVGDTSDAGECCSEIQMCETRSTDVCGNIRKTIVKMKRYWVKAGAHSSKLKAAKTVLLVTACFVCTWTPYYVAIIMYVNCDIMKNGYACIPLETLTLGPLYFLGVSNSLCDPLIYAWWHSGFKRTMRKIYWKYVWKMRIFRIRHGYTT